MEQLERRIKFVMEDLHQAMVLKSDDITYTLAVLDAYRTLAMLLDVLSYKRNKK